MKKRATANAAANFMAAGRLPLARRDVEVGVGGGLRIRGDAVAALLIAAGAVVGGRLVHAFDFASAYAAQPASLLDLGRGSLSLVGAVAGGMLTGAYVARLLGYRAGAWLDAAAVPLLFAIGAGKLAMALGGAGQGAPASVDWATVYAGTGWVSANSAVGNVEVVTMFARPEPAFACSVVDVTFPLLSQTGVKTLPSGLVAMNVCVKARDSQPNR